MHRPLLTLAFLLVLVSNCERRSTVRLIAPAPPGATASGRHFIQGIVREGNWRSPPGPVVSMARVWLGGDFDRAVYTDSLGRYALPVDPIGTDSVTVFAANGYTPGMMYAVTCRGSTRALLNSWGAVNVEIRLDQCSPI